MSISKKLIQQWAQQDAITPDNVPRALAVAEVMPSASQWRLFLDQLLLACGIVLMLSGIVFFFAFNWQELPYLHKFVIIEGLIFVSLSAYHFWFIDLSARALLLVASVLVGVLLAFFGQTYQTGADNWELFATWAALITPWALLARFSLLWLLWLVLINISITLYYQLFYGFFGFVFSGKAMQLVLWIVNTFAVALWELAATRYDWLKGRREVRLLAIISGVSITWLTVDAIFSSAPELLLMMMFYFAWLGGGYWLYRRWLVDLFMLAGGCLTIIVTSIAIIANQFLHHGNSESFLLLAAWVLIVSVWLIGWLKKVAQEQHDE